MRADSRAAGRWASASPRPDPVQAIRARARRHAAGLLHDAPALEQRHQRFAHGGDQPFLRVIADRDGLRTP